MSLASYKNPESLSEGGLELLIQLVNTYIISEVFNWIIIFLASEYYPNIDFNKNVIKGGARSDYHIVDYILLSNKILNSGLQIN